MKKPVAKMAKAKSNVKANPSKDYMKPVGGTKQKGYMAPGSELRRQDSRDNPPRTIKGGYQVGKSATDTLSVLQRIGPKGANQVSQYLKTGINPTAMKATAGNPKPTRAQLEKAKKTNASKAKNKLMETQAQKKRNTKPVKGSTKGSTINSKPSPKPTTGVYRRNQG